MVGGTMTAAAKPDNRHAGRERGLHANGAVFNHNAALARGLKLLRGEQKKVGGGLSPRDLRGAEDMRIKERQQPGDRERVTDPIEVAVRGDATRRRQYREQLLDAGYRDQLALESDIDARTKRLEEPIGQNASEPAL